jgi:hypothetical protein
MQRSVPANGVLPHGAESMPGEAAQLLEAANFVRDNVVWYAGAAGLFDPTCLCRLY